jgi:hypothetical protein
VCKGQLLILLHPQGKTDLFYFKLRAPELEIKNVRWVQSCI